MNKILRISVPILVSVLALGAYSSFAFAGMTPVVISEFSSDGVASSDWVELQNTTGIPISLSGWKLQDLTFSGGSASMGNISGTATTTIGAVTIPAYGLVIITPTTGGFNQDGDMITLYDSTGNQAYAVSYGSISFGFEEHVTGAPASASQSASRGTSSWSIGTPTKGWFNDAQTFDCSTPLTSAPTLSSIASCLSASPAGITTNIGTISNPSATPSTEGTGALYFDKAGKGKIVFEKALNLSDTNTVTILQSLGTAMEMSDGYAKFDSTTATAMNATGAKIYMYGLQSDGGDTLSASDLVVKDDAESVIGSTGLISGFAWNSSTGVLSFSASHFTSFFMPDTMKPVISSFDITPATSDSLTVNNIHVGAHDNPRGNPTDYKFTESNIKPLASSSGWNSFGASSYTYIFETPGTKTLYVWAKDASGNVSDLYTDQTVTITLAPPATPTLDSIAITSPATKLSYLVGDSSVDITGLVVTGTYSDTTTKTETITTGDVFGFDSSVPTTGQTLTIHVGAQTTTYTVNIVATSTVSVDNLQPDWITGEGVFSAYIGPTAYGYVSPGATALYNGREAGIIKAGLNLDADGHYWDEGLFGFKPTVTINDLAAGTLTYDVDNQYGENPVWMTIEIDTGVADEIAGNRNDNTTYQFVPTTNPAGWQTVNAGAGQWQKWADNNGTVTGPLMTLSEVASANTGLNVVRAYLRLGMGDSYHGVAGLGTIAWVDKVTLGGTAYDFVVPEATPTCTSGVLNGDGVSDTVQLVLTCSHAVKFASSGTATANATDLGRIVMDGPHYPNSATISGNELTLTFNAADGTFTQNIGISAGALANNSNVLNATISIASGSITDHAKPKVWASAISSPKLANEVGGFGFSLSNTEGGNVTYSGGCTTDNTTMGWANLWTSLKWNGGSDFPEGVYDSCTITITDTAGNAGTTTVPTFIVDTTGPVTGDVTITPSYKVGAVTYISGLSTISAPVTDAGVGVDGSTCEYSLDADTNTNVHRGGSYSGGVCTFTDINTSGATGINVRAQYDNGNYHQGTIDPAKTVLVTVDVTAPTTTDNVPSAWQTSATTITLTCNDDSGSGCSKVYYTTNGDIPTTSSSFVDAGSSWQFTVSSDGQYTIKYFAVDNIGNQETVKTAGNTLKIDNAAPAGGSLTMVTSLHPAGITVATPTAGVYTLPDLSMDGADVFNSLTVVVTDANLNTADVPVLVDGVTNGYMHYDAGIWNYEGQTAVLPDFSSGTHNLVATFSDTAGNTTTLTATFTTDNAGPAGGSLTMITNLHPAGITVATPTAGVYTLPDLSMDGADVFNSLTVVVTDANLNTADVPVLVDGVTNGYMHYDAGIWNYEGQTAVLPDFSSGTHNLVATFSDTAGNTTTLTATFTTDNTAPTATVSYNVTTPTNGSVVATITPSEPVTGDTTHTFTDNGAFTFNFTDVAGNTGSTIATVSNIDKTAPTVVSVDSDGQTYSGSTASPHTIKVTFSEDITNEPTIDIHSVTFGRQTVNNCGDSDAKTFCFDYTIPTSQEATHTIYVYSAQDVAGNTMTQDTSHTFVVDTKAPTVSGVTTTTLDGAYAVGQVIDFSVTFSEPVDVSGTDISFALNSGPGRKAVYAPGSGSTNMASLNFLYTVGTEDGTSDLSFIDGSIALNGGATIKDASGNDANLTLSGQSAFGLAHAIVIDTRAPTATVSYDVTAPTNGSVVATITPSESVTGDTAHTFTDNGSYTFNFTDTAGNTGSTTASVSNIDKAAPTVVLSDDHTDSTVRDADTVVITATFTENDQIDEITLPTISIHSVNIVNNAPMTKVSNLVWTYTWNVPSGSNGTHTVSVSAKDRAGNSNAVATGKTSYTIDNIAPSVTELGDGTLHYSLSSTCPSTACSRGDIYGDVLVFNEELDSTSKDAVEAAITAGASVAPRTYVWSGNRLRIYATEAVTFSNNVLATVSDLAGNTSTNLLLINSDSVAPELVSAKTTSITTIDVTFSEDLQEDELTPGDFEVNNGGNIMTVTDVSENNGVVTLTLNSSDSMAADSTPTIIINPGVPQSIVDLAGNEQRATDSIQATNGIPPVISEQSSSDVSQTALTVIWTTNHLATSRVIYDTVSHSELGEAPNYGYANSTDEANTDPMVTDHSVTLSDLSAGTTYYVRTVSHGSPTTVGSEIAITTSSAPASGGGGGNGGGSIISFGSGVPNPLPGVGSLVTTTTTTNQGQVLGASVYIFTKDFGIGSRGADVIALQQFLLDSSYSIPAGVTGYFGSQTKAAVKAFQKANGLPQTGYVGPLTRVILNRGVIATNPENSSNLTTAQINSIISVLQSFGLDQATLDRVLASLS